MSENENNGGEAAATSEKAKAAPKEIIRGRMPVAVVYLARFGSLKDAATKAVADAFGTTVGKIDDIKKNRNFSYVNAEFRPTESQKADGVAWLKRHPTGADALIAELEAVEVASAEQAAAFETARSAARGQSSTDAEGKPVEAGGGNRRGGKKKAEGAEAAPAAGSGEALLG